MQMFNQVALGRCILEVKSRGAATVAHLLTTDVRLAMLHELDGYRMRQEPAEYGQYNTKQAFKSVSEFEEGSLFLQVRDELEAWLNAGFSTEFPSYLSEPLNLNQVVAQTYAPTPVGISAHRDGKSFINLIAILVLEGKGRFCVCDDREGSNAYPLRNEPGDLLLMRGPGFLMSDYQPFHFVDSVTEKRTIFALRHKKTA